MKIISSNRMIDNKMGGSTEDTSGGFQVKASKSVWDVKMKENVMCRTTFITKMN